MPHSKFLSQVFQVGFWCRKKQIWSTHWVDWEDDLKNEDDFKNEDDHKNEGELKNEDDLNMKMAKIWRQHEHEDNLKLKKPDLEDHTRPKLTQP